MRKGDHTFNASCVMELVSLMHFDGRLLDALAMVCKLAATSCALIDCHKSGFAITLCVGSCTCWRAARLLDISARHHACFTQLLLAG